jgi:hypothetical protein
MNLMYEETPNERKNHFKDAIITVVTFIRKSTIYDSIKLFC